MATEDCTKPKADAFTAKMNDAINGGWLTLGLAIGDKLGLLKTMCEFDEMTTAQRIADASGCKERYVREWLFLMTSFGVVEMTEDSKSFFLPFDHRPCVTAQNSPLAAAPYIPLLGCAFPQLIEAFKKDGPAGIDLTTALPALNHFEGTRDIDAVIEVLLTQLPVELIHLLESGIECCDIGGGRGNFVNAMAQRFPKSHFTNCDLNTDAREKGEEDARRLGNTNVTFVIQDVTELPHKWDGKFHYIITIESLHDFPFPLKALQEMKRVLKPGGYVSVIDLKVDSDPHMSVQNKGSDYDTPVLYAFSLLHCLPLSLATPGSAGIGTFAGHQMLRSLITEAGLRINARYEIPLYYHFLCSHTSV